MFKNLILSIIGIAFLSIICDLLIPNGSMKKYAKLVMGFIMISVLISAFTKGNQMPDFQFSFNETMSEEEIRALSDAYILRAHKENLRERIEAICGENIEAFVEVFQDGRVKSVTLRGNVEQSTVMYLKGETGCDNIKVYSGEESET